MATTDVVAIMIRGNTISKVRSKLKLTGGQCSASRKHLEPGGNKGYGELLPPRGVVLFLCTQEAV